MEEWAKAPEQPRSELMLKRVSPATARASAMLAVAVCAVLLAHAPADAGSAEQAGAITEA